MTIHYKNAKDEEMMLSGIIHLQNIDDETWDALLESGRTLTLRTSRIEGIYHENTKTVNITARREQEGEQK